MPLLPSLCWANLADSHFKSTSAYGTKQLHDRDLKYNAGDNTMLSLVMTFRNPPQTQPQSAAVSQHAV